MFGIGSMITIALRLVTHRGEIEKLWPRVQSTAADIEQLLPQIQAALQAAQRAAVLAREVRELMNKIAPEFMPPLATRMGAEPRYDVKWLQSALNQLVDAKLVVDGEYGELTRAAVKKFQRANGLVMDGWAGVATEAAIEALLWTPASR